jgi:hypothetical protein
MRQDAASTCREPSGGAMGEMDQKSEIIEI